MLRQALSTGKKPFLIFFFLISSFRYIFVTNTEKVLKFHDTGVSYFPNLCQHFFGGFKLCQVMIDD